MATFEFTGRLPSSVIEEYHIDDKELEGKTDEEKEEIIQRHHAQWVVDVAAASIEGGWERID